MMKLARIEDPNCADFGYNGLELVQRLGAASAIPFEPSRAKSAHEEQWEAEYELLFISNGPYNRPNT